MSGTSSDIKCTTRKERKRQKGPTRHRNNRQKVAFRIHQHGQTGFTGARRVGGDAGAVMDDETAFCIRGYARNVPPLVFGELP